VTEELRHRFAATVIFYNAAVYPVAVAIWILCDPFTTTPNLRELIRGNPVAPEERERASDGSSPAM